MYISFENSKEKINKSFCQTYSRNKVGLKLFLFREYGPKKCDTAQDLTMLNAVLLHCTQGLSHRPGPLVKKMGRLLPEFRNLTDVIF